MHALRLCARLAHVSLSLIDCTMSVPTNGQRGSWPKVGPCERPWPLDWALKPDGSPKLTCGRRPRTLLPAKIRGNAIGWPLESLSGSRLSEYFFVPPTAVEATWVMGLTPC